MTKISRSDVYSLVKPKRAKGAGKMIGRWRQSLLVGLTAALCLGAAGAYALSLGSLARPSHADLPIIALSGPIDPVSVASTLAPEPALEATPVVEAPSKKPTVPAAAPPKSSRPAAEKDEPREVVTPDVREEDSHDHHDDHDDDANDIHKQGDEESLSRESSSRDEPELCH